MDDNAGCASDIYFRSKGAWPLPCHGSRKSAVYWR